MKFVNVCLVVFILCSCSSPQVEKSEIEVISVPTQRPATVHKSAPMAASENYRADRPVEPRQIEHTQFYAAAEQGAVVVGWGGDNRQCIYRKKCDSCGYVLPGRTSTVLNANSTYKSSFTCPHCKHSQQVSIMCSGGK